MEAFRRIMAARQKKRSPTKKEKDQAWKILKERETLAKQLNTMWDGRMDYKHLEFNLENKLRN